MQTEIVVNNWKVITKDDKSKTVAGEYAVRLAGKQIAKEPFNEGFSHTAIAIPAQLLAEIEAIDAKVRQAVIDNFTK